VIIEFVDTTDERRVPHDDGPVGEGRAAVRAGARALTMNEQLGLSTKTQRFTPHRRHSPSAGDRSAARRAWTNSPASSGFARAEEAAGHQFKDLEAAVTTKINLQRAAMLARADLLPATSSSVMVNITLAVQPQGPAIQQTDNVFQSGGEHYARITTMSRRVPRV